VDDGHHSAGTERQDVSGQMLKECVRAVGSDTGLRSIKLLGRIGTNPRGAKSAVQSSPTLSPALCKLKTCRFCREEGGLRNPSSSKKKKPILITARRKVDSKLIDAKRPSGNLLFGLILFAPFVRVKGGRDGENRKRCPGSRWFRT